MSATASRVRVPRRSAVRCSRGGRPRLILLVSIICAGGLFWAGRHVVSMVATFEGKGSQFAAVYTLAFLVLAWQMLLCHLERPYVATAEQQAELDQLLVTVNVPVYNEDPQVLRRALWSLLQQSRLPTKISVVDDGSTVDYGSLPAEWQQLAASQGVATEWKRTVNRGKRWAQAGTFAFDTTAEIFITVDSDTMLDYEAIGEVLTPFVDTRVTSVAGVGMAYNNRHNLLTRLTDLWFVTGQLVDRSSLSFMGSVLVNSGVLAAYDAEIIRNHLKAYLNETFHGRKVEFSDDSMLTTFCLMKGRAVQQPTAIAFTMLPEKLSHHLRQQLRWMRGAFIRSWWRFKYLPLDSYVYWAHFLGWVSLALSTVIFTVLFVVRPVVHHEIIPALILIPLLVGYGQALRYLGYRRSDESFGSQLLTWAMAPVATLWNFFVLRPIRFYAMLTCLRTGWGTRSTVEVELDAGRALGANP